MSKIVKAERSKIPARSRMARCSALMIGDHQRASHSALRRVTRSPNSSSRSALDSYHCGRSQPAASKKTAPRPLPRAWEGGVPEVAVGRPLLGRVDDAVGLVEGLRSSRPDVGTRPLVLVEAGDVGG